MGIGGTEIFIILILVLVFFGGKKLPELGGALGKSIVNFKKGLSGNTSEDNNDKKSS